MWLFYLSLVFYLPLLIWIVLLILYLIKKAFYTDNEQEINDGELSIIQDKNRDGIIVSHRYFISNEEVDLFGQPVKSKTVTKPNTRKIKPIKRKTEY